MGPFINPFEAFTIQKETWKVGQFLCKLHVLGFGHDTRLLPFIAAIRLMDLELQHDSYNAHCSKRSTDQPLLPIPFPTSSYLEDYPFLKE